MKPTTIIAVVVVGYLLLRPKPKRKLDRMEGTRDRAMDRAPKPPPDPLITFPPLGEGIPGDENWCWPNEPWGGWSDEKKIQEATKLYVATWGFSPPEPFRTWVAKYDPCRAQQVADQIRKFPPFPGETIRASVVVQRQKDQANARALEANEQAESEAQCKAALALTGTILGAAGGAYAGGGKGAAAGAQAGAKLGELTGVFC